MGCVVRQQADINFLNDMVAYMQNLGAANDGKHQNMPSLIWCAARRLAHMARLSLSLSPGSRRSGLADVIIMITRDRSNRYHSLSALHTGDDDLRTMVLGMCQALAQVGLERVVS